ncbi:MAG: 2,3,4,5-tetrahydropyridine-2,6-dicarboxylate N-succinyltransferase [Epsilonproteobacteria bacterium]|nr:MAG: 2,3,4,5-tetrahydropyridine-2,6-dicarboxylate N-succinyltransferase [Campylobacterota bacterium]RLA67185.1 MAG: 2,3,4,5-tetrahydropyridine-2,6-dicarboxylate N-succinyltransferase [Campylobacterota bacterium]
MNWEKTLTELEKGNLRAAYKENGVWKVNLDVKMAILEAFKAGELIAWEGFVDKHNLLPQKFTPQNNIRLVPGGSSVRKGAYVSSGVIIMPPAYINIGAYVDQGSMVDSHCLVGSCAQIGKNVHLSAGVQIGGVLEPIGERPVIIEDDAFIGAGSVLVEGIQVGKKAVIAPGVVLSKSVPIYDLVNERVLAKEEPIPENAVIIPGTRPVRKEYEWAHSQGLSLNCALIVKYRDEKSDTSLELESFLR